METKEGLRGKLLYLANKCQGLCYVRDLSLWDIWSWGYLCEKNSSHGFSEEKTGDGSVCFGADDNDCIKC